MNGKGWKILTALHMTVDGLCACSLFSLVPSLGASTIAGLFWLYNCLAFLTQPFVGLFLDKMGVRTSAFVLSIILLMSGGLLDLIRISEIMQINPYLIAVLIGMGNSIFHIYGGKYVTEFSGNSMRHLGIFVSTGAFGLYVGQRGACVYGMIAIMLIMLLLSLLMVRNQKHSYSSVRGYRSSTVGYRLDSTLQYSLPLFAFVLLIVFFRSFLGKMIPPETKFIEYFALSACILAVVGKATGSIIAEMFGVGRALFITLMLAGVFFMLGYYELEYLLAMILFINFSMPITLHIANRCFPRHQGFAFGMLAAFLIPGYALGNVSVNSYLAYHLLYPLIATIIMEALVLLMLRERRWNVLAASVVINIMTNVPLNLYVWYKITSISLLQFVMFESIVFVVESLLYLIVTRNIRKSILYAFLCNLISCLGGILFQMIMQ